MIDEVNFTNISLHKFFFFEGGEEGEISTALG